MKNLALIVASLTALNACTPSLPYLAGQGFYSENNKFTKHQAEVLMDKSSTKDLGYFSVSNGGCGFYSRDAADEGIVIPAVKEKLQSLGGNVANGILAKESVGVDILLGLLIIPGFLACSNWTISGNALFITDVSK